MIIIPAIDVRDGKCVRLVQGDYARETIYDDNSVEVAMSFARMGATRIHVVNLDAARGAADNNSERAIIELINAAAEHGVEVELGGGIRNLHDAQIWVEAGVRYVILGSVALREPELARQIADQFRDKVLLALDTRDNQAFAQGWLESAGDASVYLREWNTWPVGGVVCTAIARDGMLTGPDLQSLGDCCAIYTGPVIASGGVSSLDDITACVEAGASGAVLGRAIYEGTVSLEEILQRFPQSKSML